MTTIVAYRNSVRRSRLAVMYWSPRKSRY